MDSQLLEWPAQLKRPEGTNPPPDRNFDDRHTLDNDSLESLVPQKWLDDGVINTFVRSLCLARPGEYIAFDSTALESLRNIVNLEDATSRSQAEIDEHFKPFRTLAATVIGNRGLVFMPFCVPGHWILVVADLHSRIIRVYDSMVSLDVYGRVAPSRHVDMILPYVRAILAFCLDEDQWAVERMSVLSCSSSQIVTLGPVALTDTRWLPIHQTTSECGVYICLMALQHACMRGFTIHQYVGHYHEPGQDLVYYHLEACYWMVGRRIILEVCRRYFKSDSDEAQPKILSVENDINNTFRAFYDPYIAGAQTSSTLTYHTFRFWTLRRVINGLMELIKSIESLGSPEFLEKNRDIQNKARQVVLTRAGEPHRDEIVDEAVKYAWHDVEALRNLEADLKRAVQGLINEFSSADQFHRRAAFAAYVHTVAQERDHSEEVQSATEHGSPSSPDRD